MTEPRRRSVLVADDDAAVRQVYVEYLEQRGFEVAEATNGLAALLHVKRRRPGSVLLDLSMPRLGGIEALRHIRAFDATIDVIVVTAVVEPRVREEALARGARVVLAKPVALPELLAALEAGFPAAPAAPAPGASVLVVDDEPGVLDLLVEFLTLHRYAARGVPDAAAALEAVTAGAPDVVLLDIDLPGLRGVDALPAIHALAPETKVIMVSGNADAAVARRALALGAFDYVVKPIDLGYLAQSIETALAMKSLGSRGEA